jgi:hypothetical protein
MKKFKLFVVGLLFITTSQAQISVNVNLGTPPVWAPAKSVQTQYYYLPEINSYYDVPSQRFIYFNNGKWVRSEKLPSRYKNYNLHNGKVVYLTDYRGNAPYVYNKKHKVKYETTIYRPGKVIYVKTKHDNGKHKGEEKHEKHDKHDDD